LLGQLSDLQRLEFAVAKDAPGQRWIDLRQVRKMQAHRAIFSSKRFRLLEATSALLGLPILERTQQTARAMRLPKWPSRQQCEASILAQGLTEQATVLMLRSVR
jgi:hypothetical protein